MDVFTNINVSREHSKPLTKSPYPHQGGDKGVPKLTSVSLQEGFGEGLFYSDSLRFPLTVSDYKLNKQQINIFYLKKISLFYSN